MEIGNCFGRRKVGELQQSKGWKWEVGTGEGIRVKVTVMDWIWRLCNMVFEWGVVPEDWRSPVIVPLYKGKGDRTM